tara:strand:+ start:61 stop:222 length:162 start_codon:yes stop_codon:yes gene_type:complete
LPRRGRKQDDAEKGEDDDEELKKVEEGPCEQERGEDSAERERVEQCVARAELE